MNALKYRFKIIGVSDDRTDCECCGKPNLKCTVMLGRLDCDGTVEEVVYFGRDCAARAMTPAGFGRPKTANAMEKLARQVQEDAARAERTKTHLVGDDRSVCTWVVESIGQNGNSITLLGYANGLKSLVEPWAEQRWPGNIIHVRKAI